jgi:hypothetical protein
MLQGKKNPLTILFLKVTKNRENLVKIASLQTGLCSRPSSLPKNQSVTSKKNEEQGLVSNSPA